MKTKEMTAEFSANVKANIEQLADLFKAYDLAELGYKMQEEQCHNEALNAGEYYAAEGCNVCGVNIKQGDRVTDEKFAFLLSDEDWGQIHRRNAPISGARRADRHRRQLYNQLARRQRRRSARPRQLHNRHNSP